MAKKKEKNKEKNKGKKKKKQKKSKDDEEPLYLTKEELQKKAHYWHERHKESYFLYLTQRTSRSKTFSYYIACPMLSYVRPIGGDDESDKKGKKKGKKKPKKK